MAKKNPIIIGNNAFKYKKDAVAHYRKILNSYSFGESLNESDFYDIIDLLNYDYTVSEDELELDDSIDDNEQQDHESDIYITDIKVSKVQFSTKCFEVFYSDNSSCYISYLMILNNTKYTPEKLFNAACRSAINKDIRDVKQRYFDHNNLRFIRKMRLREFQAKVSLYRVGLFCCFGLLLGFILLHITS